MFKKLGINNDALNFFFKKIVWARLTLPETFPPNNFSKPFGL